MSHRTKLLNIQRKNYPEKLKQSLIVWDNNNKAIGLFTYSVQAENYCILNKLNFLIKPFGSN